MKIKNIMKKVPLIFLLALVFFLGLFSFLYVYQTSSLISKKPLPTYFKYDESELSQIKGLEIPNLTINTKSLRQWDEILFDLVRKHQLKDIDAANIYAYFLTAQRDFVYLIRNLYGNYYGTLDPISKEVLCLFFPQDCNQLQTQQDSFSESIATIVLSKIKRRLREELEKEKIYEEPPGVDYKGHKPYIGQTAGSKIPWFIKSSSHFRVPPPPSKDDPKWDEEIKAALEARKKITDDQKKAVIYWSGGPGTITAPGIWLDIANDYMWQNNLPLEKILLVQSTLAMALADAVIAVYDSKYTYWVIRPYLRDPSLKTIMPTPFHPSYPAGHSTISMAAATVLSYFFPEEQHRWIFLAKQASQSRVWGGIHYPIDTEQGEILGTNVANSVIKNLKTSTEE